MLTHVFTFCNYETLIYALSADFSRKRKRSRWNDEAPEQKTIIPGMPTVIPPGLSRDQERAYIGNITLPILPMTFVHLCQELRLLELLTKSLFMSRL